MKFEPRDLGDSSEASSGRTDWREKAKNAGIVICFLVGCYLFLGLMADVAATSIPDDVEARYLGSLGLLEASEPESSDSDHAAFKRCEEILKTLISAGDMRQLPFRLILNDSPDPNAFAIPGGCIGVTRGLLNEVTSDRGLAMVLAHELGHHQHRHPLKHLGRSLVVSLGMNLIVPDSSTAFIDFSVSSAECAHSRSQEMEADEYALRLVDRVYGDTQGALEFFEKMRLKQAEDPGFFEVFMASHPLTESRITHLRQLARKLDAGHGDSAPGP